jgi:PEP-CTERM motif
MRNTQDARLRSGLLVLIAWFGLVATADAATLSISPDKTTYLVGERITLTVIGDDEGAVSDRIYGRLEFDGSLVDFGGPGQTRLIGASEPWNTLILRSGEDIEILDPAGQPVGGPTEAIAEAFHQRPAIAEDTATNLPGVLSTVILSAQATGVVNVNWHTAADAVQLKFFGLTNAPGTSFTIVPEPTTAALLAFGLLGLAVGRTRRIDDH